MDDYLYVKCEWLLNKCRLWILLHFQIISYSLIQFESHCISGSARSYLLKAFVSELQLTTHQWIQGYLRKAFCWFFLKVFELEISPIPIFTSSFQGLSDEQSKFSLWSTQQLTLNKTRFWAIYLTNNKTFLPLRNFEIFLD